MTLRIIIYLGAKLWVSQFISGALKSVVLRYSNHIERSQSSSLVIKIMPNNTLIYELGKVINTNQFSFLTRSQKFNPHNLRL